MAREVTLLENEAALDQFLLKQPKAIILFYASWCPFSRQFLPVFEAFAREKGEPFARITVDPDNDNLFEKYSIEVYPTVLFFEKGKVAIRLDGIHGEGLDEHQLTEFIKVCDFTKVPDYTIKVSKNGPYLVAGTTPLNKEIIVEDKKGIPIAWEKTGSFPVQQSYALCRCGSSKNKPYCDGAHARIGFDGTETAGHTKFIEMAENNPGPELNLLDAEKLCAVAKFCHRAGDAWRLTERSDDPKAKATAIQEACDCPGGRLVAIDKKTGKAIEPAFEPSISVVEIPNEKLSGPLWVKGRIPIESAEGITYEVRNRVTLCRCGKSENKPFCDGAHCNIKFNDGMI